MRIPPPTDGQGDGQLPDGPNAPQALHPGAAPGDKAACLDHPAFATLHGTPGDHAIEHHPDFFARPEDRA
jgi:hypothetical protein